MAGNSLHYDSMVALKARYESLNLTGLTGGVIFQELFTYQDENLALPFVSISPFGPEKTGDETSYRDGFWPGILVGIVGPLSVNDLELRLSWREKLIRASMNFAFTSIPDHYTTKVEPGNAIEWGPFMTRKLYVSTFMVRIMAQMTRLP